MSVESVARQYALAVFDVARRNDRIGDALSQEIGLGHAEHLLGRRVKFKDGARFVEDDHTFRRRVEHSEPRRLAHHAAEEHRKVERTGDIDHQIEELHFLLARLLHSLETIAPPKNREEEAAKAKARAAERFGD